MGGEARVALVTYSTKPRGGVVHTLSLAEALQRQGFGIHVIALGDPAAGFFRPTGVPHTIIPAPAHRHTLEQRVFASIDTLAEGLAGLAGDFDLLHTQDCIAARAAARVRDAGAPVTVLRTVHHVDDFTTQALVDCQRLAIKEPDRVLVVSEQWRRILREDYGRDADVALPETIQAVLASRIDRLAPGDKDVLQAAAVIGRDVPIDLLRSATGLPAGELDAALDRLASAELIGPAGTDGERAFQHPLTQEVAHLGDGGRLARRPGGGGGADPRRVHPEVASNRFAVDLLDLRLRDPDDAAAHHELDGIAGVLPRLHLQPVTVLQVDHVGMDERRQPD